MQKPVEILLVEDSPFDAELALRALRQNNLVNNIVHVTDGEEALDFLYARGPFANRQSHHLPKVILLDLKLPKVGGLEVLQVIKSDDNLKKIPVVVMTSSREEKDLIESYSLGANSYLVKPVAFEKFIHSVREVGMYWLLLNQSPEN